MIVKNGEAGIARCLASVRDIADHITIGDTGSTDDTLRIAREFGAKILSVPWQNDFAAARNGVLSQANCDWILFLDADEMRLSIQLPHRSHTAHTRQPAREGTEDS